MNKQYHRNSYGQMFKSWLMILLTLFLSVFFVKSYALVFNIVPNGSLPTSVDEGSTVPASYVVQNNTLSQRNNNFIKYLPPNVSVAPGGCGNIFNLAPHGQPGDSCILNLTVSGRVIAKDPNPHNHLFVCFPGGITCAGTPFPLNVEVTSAPPPPPEPSVVSISITPVNATITIGGTQQYTAIGHFEDGSNQNITTTVTWNSSNPGIATIDATGLAHGVSAGNTNITASSGPINSNIAMLTVTATIIWAVHDSNVITFCPVNPNGTLGTCTNVDGSGLTTPQGMAVNNTFNIAYVVNGNSISICPLNQNGTFGSCTPFTDPLLTGGTSIALNPTNTFAYISIVPADQVIFCPILPGGGLGACSNTTGAGFLQPLSIEINNTGSQAYILNASDSSVSRCPINPDGTFGVCAPHTPVLPLGQVPGGLALNTVDTFAYITNAATGAVVVCQINGTGDLINCQTAFPAGTLTPGGIVTNVADTLAYVASGNNSIFRCPISAVDGTFTTCINTANSGANLLSNLTFKK